MPKVKNPLFSQEARGGMGGLVFNTWRGINTVKTNTSPTGQGTAKRLAAQALMAVVSKEWQGLLDADRAAWNQYAIDHPVTDWTGAPKRLTGMNWYIKCNLQLHILGAASVDTPPIVAAPDPVSAFTLAQTGDDLTCTWGAPTDGDHEIRFFVAGPLSAGRAAKIEQASFLMQKDGTETQPLHLIADAAAGRYTVFVHNMDRDNGLISTYVSDFFDIT
jgi:hypothetical protein